MKVNLIDTGYMATYENGINGAFSGKVGSVIGYKYRGINVMRAVGKRKAPKKQGEQVNQSKMALVSKFLAPLKPFLQIGFELVSRGTKAAAFHHAQSHARKHAVIDADPPYIDASKVLITKGDLPPAKNARVQVMGNELVFTWDIEPWEDSMRGYDRAMLFLYGERNSFIDMDPGSATRMDGKASLKVAGLMSELREGAPVHAYLAFITNLRDGISDSVYCPLPAIG